jgi:predicted dehydrogenase
VDWGIHNIDIIRTIMGYDMPMTIEAQGGIHALQGKTNTPDTLRAMMQFGEVPLIWQHRLWGTGEMDPQYNNGIFFHGEKGTLFAADNRLVLKAAGHNSQQEVMEIPSPRMQEEHVAEFIKAVRTGNRELISCTIDDAFRSTATVQLAMIAYETGSRVKWDAERQTITGNEAAAAMLARPYREGYQRP